MTVTDRISPGTLESLPPEAGDVNAPRFLPDEAWLGSASPVQQKMAMWRWFATHHDAPMLSTPHDDAGNFLYSEGEPLLADQVLHQRFDAVVPPEVVEELVHAVQEEAGNEWVPKRLDKFSG